MYPGIWDSWCIKRNILWYRRDSLLTCISVLSWTSRIRDFTCGCLAPALFWPKFLGHLASFVDIVPYCRMLMRLLQLHCLRFFFPLIDSQDKLVPLSPEIKALCRAWASPSRLLEGKPFAPPPLSLVVTTDASYLGWGAILHPHRVSRVWSRKEALDLINSLELKAVLLTLQNLESHILGRSVLICSDIMTVVSFINYQGGTISLSLCRLALDLWEWCPHRNIFPPGSSHSGRRDLCGGFSLQGKVSPFRMGPESFSFSEVLEVRRVVFSLDGSSTCTRFLPSLFSPGSWTRLPRMKRIFSWLLHIGLRGLGFLDSFGSW